MCPSGYTGGTIAAGGGTRFGISRNGQICYTVITAIESWREVSSSLKRPCNG